MTRWRGRDGSARAEHPQNDPSWWMKWLLSAAHPRKTPFWWMKRHLVLEHPRNTPFWWTAGDTVAHQRFAQRGLAGRKNTRYAPLCLRDIDALKRLSSAAHPWGRSPVLPRGPVRSVHPGKCPFYGTQRLAVAVCPGIPPLAGTRELARAVYPQNTPLWWTE